MKPSTLPSLLRRGTTALLGAVLSLLGLCALAAAPASARSGVTAVTATVVTSSANPATVAQSVTFTAVVDYSPGHSVPGGYVDFAVPGTYMFLYSAQQEALACNQVPIENGVATCEVAGGWELAGADTVSAKYLGATGYATSSGTLSQTVRNTQIATTESVTSSVAPSVVGQTVAFTAHVDWSDVIGPNASVGTVDFIVTGNPVLPGVFSGNTLEALGCSAVPVTEGSATCTTYAGWAQTGTYTVTAVYDGTGSALPFASQVTQVVSAASTVVQCTYSPASETASVSVGPAAPSIYDAGITGTVVTETYVDVLDAQGDEFFTGTYSGSALTVNEAGNAQLAVLAGQTLVFPVTFTSTSPGWGSSTGDCTVT